jgi:hypothetical protein
VCGVCGVWVGVCVWVVCVVCGCVRVTASSGLAHTKRLHS